MNTYKTFLIVLVDGTKLTFSETEAVTVDSFYNSLFKRAEYLVNEDPKKMNEDIFIPRLSICYIKGIREVVATSPPEFRQEDMSG